MTNRPFFSVIIPCYNSNNERIKELLESILKAGCNDITEIIISDDKSDNKSYLNEIENYKENFLDIKVVTVPNKNEEGIKLIHCPGNTREYGVKEAKGKWITFIDHDDLFAENAFIKIKEGIENNNEKYMISGNLLNFANKNKIIKSATNWLHGKFYNLDNFWKKYDLHFKTNLFSNEDIYISIREYFIFFKLYGNKTRKGNTHIDTNVYIWRWNKDSTSNIKYNGETYMEHFFFDYIEATYDVCTDEYNKAIKNGIDNDFIYYCKCIHADSILYLFLYLQSFKYMKRTTYNKDIELTVKNKIKEYYNRYKVDYKYLFNFIKSEKDFNVGISGTWYFRAKRVVIDGVGQFKETDSFYDFLKDVEEKHNMDDNNELAKNNKDPNRPFFSIIIPCYNTKPERMRELLESIYEGGCPDDIEVIVSNDRSTNEEFLKVVNAFNKDAIITFPTDKEYNPKNYKLDIIVTDVPDVNEDGVELIHCPGNTRQNGVNHANGQWVTFIDHDDLFIKDALKLVKDRIEEENEQYFVCSNFYQIDPIENIKKEEMIHTSNWMHGKFYNLDNFWKPYNLHFKTNLFGNEDICVSAQVNCAWYRINKDKTTDPAHIPTLWIENFTYIWRSWRDSTSNLLYEDTNYMEKFFGNYMNATIDTYIEDYNNLVKAGNITDYDIEFHKMMHADVILYMYLYLQSFKFNHSNHYDLNIEFTIKKHIKEYYKRFNMTCIDLFYYIEYHEDERGKWYNNVWESVKYGVGPFIEVDSFFDFLSK